jgi:hypothetical protein
MPVPVAVVWVVALVVLALTFPLAPFVASDFNLIYMDTELTEVPLRVTVTDDPNPVPLDKDTS